jgi:hypothetical protein
MLSELVFEFLQCFRGGIVIEGYALFFLAEFLNGG